MRFEIGPWSTDGFPKDEEVKRLCRPGEGANTCVWLVFGPKGFTCSYANKNYSLMKRWEQGETVAKRDGCEEIRGLLDAAFEADASEASASGG